ncbi:MAG: response regulator transcription factor [Dysgonamonadaceae bacterium]|jgi:DNA-binding response OmpR family regulator|nr:response regulator transcription factor [Dysgonamonadaceae bacterium]
MNTNFEQPKILIVDDEPVICEILEFNLINEGFDVMCVHSAEEALKKLTPSHSLILLDVMMAGMSGYKLTEKLRQRKIETPIIFLTAKDTENDMLTGFSVGGDDYISKPFSIKEVVARVKAVLKRHDTQGEKAHGKLIFDNVTIDLELKELIIGTEKIMLTKTEFELVLLLSSNPERIYSREEIIDRVWRDTPYITERTVDVHLTRLRKKLGKYAYLIANRAGFGYRLNIAKE